MNRDAAVALEVAGRGVLALPQGGADVWRARAVLAGPDEARDGSAPSSEGALVKLACAGDRDAFGVLVSRYQDRVYTIVHGIVRDPDDALDLVQETFLKAFQGLHGFRGGSSFYTWLYRIAVNCARDFLRRRAARPAVSLEDEQLQDTGFEPVASDPGTDPVAVAEVGELRAAVREAVQALPEKLRIAVTLHDIQGLPQQEVAAIMQCPLGTAKSHVFRARARLRKLLARYVEAQE